jgi:phosphoribosylanthranilate isomerase
MTRIKICGIKEETHALVAAKTGADFIGLVFAPSRRQITVAQAAKIVSALKQSGHATEAVGLFVNCPAAEINRIADTCHLDWVQLSGDESWDEPAPDPARYLRCLGPGGKNPGGEKTHLST